MLHRIICLGALLLLSGSLTARTEEAAREYSVVERRFSEFFEMMASGDGDRYQEFVREGLAKENVREHGEARLIRYLHQIHDEEDPWVFIGFRPGRGARSTVALVRTELTHRDFAIEFSLSLEDDEIVKDLEFDPSGIPREIIEDRLDTSAVAAEMRRYFEQIGGGDRFHGAVLLAVGGQVLVDQILGDASMRYPVPNTARTKFCLGSMTKMFTAVGVLKLVEEGALSLNDPIGRYLGEEWIDEDIAEDVTIEHLLTHTAGVGDFFMHPDYRDMTRGHFRSVDRYARFCQVSSLDFEPGTKWSYSNSGFVMLGAIMEAATGVDYFTWMKEQVYGPLGMTNTGCLETDVPTPDVAEGYFLDREEDRWRSNIFSQRVRGCPAGSSYSTTQDLLTFAQAFASGLVLPSELFDSMTSAKPELGSPDYGYGIEIRPTLDGKPAIGHSGGAPGVRAWLKILPEHGAVCIVLSNRGTATDAAKMKCLELLSRWDPSS